MGAFKPCMKNLQQTSGQTIHLQGASQPDREIECNFQLSGLRRNWKCGGIKYCNCIQPARQIGFNLKLQHQEEIENEAKLKIFQIEHSDSQTE